MAISELQNFYKETVAVDCTTGATNIYVSTKPTPINGYLVISPGSESLREIIKYTGTGTDGTGDYVTIALAGDRGLGGTTDQAHIAGEAVRMNYTAEHQQEIDDTINAIVSAGAPNASTTVKGISKLSAAPTDAAEPIAVGTNDTRMNVGAGMTADEKAILVAIEDGTYFPTPQVVTFTSSGTWTKDAGLKYVVVEVQGGGGNGDSVTVGDNATSAGGGGGAGGYSKKLILASALGATETVTVGAAAAASSFGSLATANGGTTSTGVAGGDGGTAASGDINIQGGDGSPAISTGSEGDGAGGSGGNSPLGFGGKGAQEIYNIGLNGGAGRGYGGGGGGALANDDTSATGGAGAGGIVIVTEYY